jgi:hypothetical protein
MVLRWIARPTTDWFTQAREAAQEVSVYRDAARKRRRVAARPSLPAPRNARTESAPHRKSA